MPDMSITTITIDSSELLADIEKIERGELKLPTVSAVKISEFGDDLIIYLPEDCGL